MPNLLQSSLLALVLTLCLPAAQALEPVKSRPILTLSGTIGEKNAGNEAQFDAAMLDALPQHKMTVPTPWYKTPQTFEGPLFRDVLKAVGSSGKKLQVVALNDYAAEIPMDDLNRYDVILARRINGKVLAIRDKGPLFVMYPFDKHPELQVKDIFGRCVWQVNRIRIE